MTDTTPTGVPEDISEWDFGELLLFDAKVRREGFSYAFTEYGPDFRDPTLQETTKSRDAMHALYEKYTDTINALYDSGEAGALYDAHMEATRAASA